eukprot:snap_masked-scaffold_5-processed-gene-7.27-mRNA-1 protein AED:1.00 eAED:1.00 QI:0/0/0/0/1/1/2/0/62
MKNIYNLRIRGYEKGNESFKNLRLNTKFQKSPFFKKRRNFKFNMPKLKYEIFFEILSPWTLI